MQNIFKKISVLLLGGVPAVSSAQTPEYGSTHMPIFVFAGQSNMVGHSLPKRLSDSAEVKSHLVYAFPDRHPISADGLDRRGVMRFGPEYGFIKAMEAAGITQFRVLKAAVGGTSISPQIGQVSKNWHPDTPEGLFAGMLEAYEDLANSLRAEGFSPRLEGLLWMQGASDTEDLENYAQNLGAFFEELDAKWGDSFFTCIVETTYSDEWYLNTAPPAFLRRMESFDEIRLVQSKMAERRPNTVLMSSKGYETLDGLHFTPVSSFAIGVEYANAYFSHYVLPAVDVMPAPEVETSSRSREEFMRAKEIRQEMRRRTNANR